jgi:hypothetical protein
VNVHQKLSAGLIGLSVLNIGLRPESFSASILIIIAIALYAFAVAFERKDHAEFEEFKATAQKQIKELQDKVQDISLARSLGR